MKKRSDVGVKRKQTKDDKEALQDVDKEFYELQIADLNRKLARLRTRCTELELENEDVKRNLQKLDEDRADIIAYLKRTLQAKTDENSNLQEQLLSLQQAKEAEKTTFLEKIKTMEHDFKLMHEQLNSEIKLLNGKLNSLEEFRRERDILMNNYLKQGVEMEEQEKRHKIALYEVERKFIVGKDELKKDMEQKLIQLSLDFQNMTDIRIDNTTHRVIRENVAISNEINILMESWKNLYEENKDMKKKEKELKIESQMQKEDNKILLKKNDVQSKIIEKISSMHCRVQDSYKEMDQIRRHGNALEKKLEVALAETRFAREENQKLRQILNSRQVEECQHEVELHELRQHCYTLETVVATAVDNIRQGLKVEENREEEEDGDSGDQEEEFNLNQRDSKILITLLELFEKYDSDKSHPPGIKASRATVLVSELLPFSYKTGDLGLMFKSSERKGTDLHSKIHLFPRKSSERGKSQDGILKKSLIIQPKIRKESERLDKS